MDRWNYKRFLLLMYSLCYVYFLPAQELQSADSLKNETWYIHFHKGKSDLDLHLNGNKETLNRFVAKANDIQSRKDLSIQSIKIIGYASPEGPLALNERLSRERSEALRDYLHQALGFSENQFKLVAGGENWNELSVMVNASDMPNKEKVLSIIADEESPAKRKIRLKRLPEGTYRYMLQHFYPKLRSASSLQLIEMHPQKPEILPIIKEPTAVADSVAKEVTEISDSIPPTVSCRCQPPFMGIKTNLAYWAAVIVPNIELEFYWSRRYSLSLEGVHRWKSFSAAKKNVNIWYVAPEFRFYLRSDASFEGHYFGLYGQWGEYDFKLGQTGRQGNTQGGGLSYGYIFKFHRLNCLYFDLGLSAGYSRLEFDRYYWFDPCNAFDGHRKHNYIGLTKMKASLIWRF